MYYYGFDIYYFVLIIPCMILAGWAQMSVKSNFDKYSKVSNSRGYTAVQVAQRILNENGINGVRIEHVSGKLSDHYDPKNNVVRLSDSVYNSTSVAAIGVAAHEIGHVIQYHHGYFPIKVRSAIIPLTQIGSYASWPLLLLGIVFNTNALIEIGILLFAVTTLFQLITLPVELNASRRALASIKQGNILTDTEYPMAKKTLNAAAMTYVAALAVSFAQLLRLVLIFGGRSRD